MAAAAQGYYFYYFSARDGADSQNAMDARCSSAEGPEKCFGSLDEELQDAQQQQLAPFDSQAVGTDFTVPAVAAGCILLINDSTVPIHFRVHDSPNNLHVISESRGAMQGQSSSTSGRDSGSTHVSVGKSFSGRVDASWQRSQQASQNQSMNMQTTYKERKQLQAQIIRVAAASRQLVNLTTYTMEVSVDAWFLEQAKGAGGVQQRVTLNLLQGLVIKSGQVLRVGRDAPANSAWCEEATTTSSPASQAPTSTANGSGGGATGATDSTQVKGGTPDMGFQC
eukprot:gene5902-6143_t